MQMAVVSNPATDEPVLMITVLDNGTGIPEEIRDRIFEPFFTTKSSDNGTGLGLSVSYRVILHHGGTLKYKPRRNGGSEFQIVLPLCSIEEPPVTETNDKLPRGSGTILVVDDEDVVRTVSQAMLERQGFRTIGAASGEAAINSVAYNSERIDAILLDLTMPGMSGREVMRIVRQKWPDIGIILCSGYVMEGLVGIRSNDGPDAEIRKPYSMKQLINTVDEVLQIRRRSDQTRPESIGPNSAIAADL